VFKEALIHYVDRKAKRVSDWEVFYNRPLANIFKGKALLIGDAAHSVGSIPSSKKNATYLHPSRLCKL
jgi:hypothetical protein